MSREQTEQPIEASVGCNKGPTKIGGASIKENILALLASSSSYMSPYHLHKDLCLSFDFLHL